LSFDKTWWATDDVSTICCLHLQSEDIIHREVISLCCDGLVCRRFGDNFCLQSEGLSEGVATSLLFQRKKQNTSKFLLLYVLHYLTTMYQLQRQLKFEADMTVVAYLTAAA
jgi:hypothetical protein